MASRTPTCWKCGNELSGLGVSDDCPECGTPVWSRPEPTITSQEATTAQTLGIISLALFFACIGPLAAIVAIPAIIKANSALEDVRVGRVPPSAAGAARTGRVCAWLTIALSGLALVAYLWMGLALM